MGINFNIVLCSGALLRYKYGGNESKLNKFGNKGRAHHYTLTEENTKIEEQSLWFSNDHSLLSDQSESSGSVCLKYFLGMFSSDNQ